MLPGESKRAGVENEYELRPLDLSPDGLEELEGLLRLVFPAAVHLGRAFLDWSYVGNPDGAAVGCNAFAPDGTLAAHYACQPLRARVFGEMERGLLSLNTATHPEHRGRGLHGRVANDCYARAGAAGFGFVTGAANQHSTRGFVEKLDFRRVRPLDARFGLAPLPAASGHTEVEFERLWSDESLAWRLCPPGAAYTVRRNREMATVHAPAGRFGASVEMARLPVDRIPSTLPEFRSMNPLRLWIGADPDRRWSRSLTFDLPMRLRPAPLNWLFLDLRRQGRVPAADAIRVGALDFDAF